jgi:dephospho-CoA kinase
MKLIGLTGGVGMGKTTCSDFFQQVGLPVVDTDVLARDLVAPGQPALQEIRAVFGDALVDDEGALRRGTLAEMVFADEAKRGELESILHPRIRAAWLNRADAWRARGCEAGVVVIPLLFETDAASSFAATLCAACTAASQEGRLAARGWSPEMAARRIAAQWPVSRKMAAADHVVWTEGRMEATEAQLRRLLARLQVPVGEERMPGQDGL